MECNTNERWDFWWYKRRLEASALLSCKEGGGSNRRFFDCAGLTWPEGAALGFGGDVFFVDDAAVEDDGTGDVDRTLSLMEGPPPPSGLFGDGMGLVVQMSVYTRWYVRRLFERNGFCLSTFVLQEWIPVTF